MICKKIAYYLKFSKDVCNILPLFCQITEISESHLSLSLTLARPLTFGEVKNPIKIDKN